MVWHVIGLESSGTDPLDTQHKQTFATHAGKFYSIFETGALSFQSKFQHSDHG